MKRLHVNVGVEDLDASKAFYTQLFGVEPTLTKTDYARWMLDDPRVNFAISQRCGEPGVNHLGIQADDEDELDEVFARLDKADGAVLDEGETTCCYARSTKRWITDPQGVAWETFQTHGAADDYGVDAPLPTKARSASGCC